MSVPRALLLLLVCAGCAQEPTERPPLPTDRGLPYDALYLPFDLSEEQARADLAAAQALGATLVYFTCTEADLDDDRKIRVVLAAARARGLRVFADPYFGGVLSGDEGRTGHLFLARHPDDREVSRRGVVTDIPAYNSPALREHVKAQLRRLLAYDFDGLLLDEPWFPDPPTAGDYFPHDRASQAAFAARFGHPMPDAEDEEVEAFRQASMTSFLRELTDLSKALRPSLPTVLVVLPEIDESRPDYRGTRDWRALSEIATLDSLHTDPYWPTLRQPFDFFVRNVARLKESVTRPGITTGIWVQAYALDDRDSATVSRGLLHARAEGIPSINAWLTAQFPNEDDAAVRAHLADAFR